MMELIKNLCDIIFPRLCPVCGRAMIDGEKCMCLGCLSSMPRTHLHKESFNSLHQKVIRPGISVERAGAWFWYYKSTPYAGLVYDFKYRSMPRLAREAGELYAKEIKGDGFFDDIDLLLPIPMNWWRELRRGYNQAEEIAKGVSKVTGIEIGYHLTSPKRHKTQTRRNAWARQRNMEGKIRIENGDELRGLHVLVIDDLSTTGATLSAAISAIKSTSPTTRVSVLTLGTTQPT